LKADFWHLKNRYTISSSLHFPRQWTVKEKEVKNAVQTSNPRVDVNGTSPPTSWL